MKTNLSTQQKKDISAYSQSQAAVMIHCYEQVSTKAAEKGLELSEAALVAMAQAVYIDVVRAFKLN